MANHKSAKKRTRQILKRARINNQKLYFGFKGGTSSFSATFHYNTFIHTNNDINYTDNTITISPAHNLKTGDEIFYLPFDCM